MKKGSLPLIGLTVTALSITACVQQIWQVTYEGPDQHFSEFHELTQDSSGNLVVLAEIKTPDSNNSSQAILKYDSQGNLIWETIIPHVFNFDGFSGKDFIATSPDNHIFTAGITIGEGNKLTLLNEDGDIQWTNVIGYGFQEPSILFDIEATYDNQFLALGLYPDYNLVSYNEDGDVLWENDGGSRLDAFNINRPPQAMGEVVVNTNNDIFFSNGSAINKLNTDGETTARITTNDLDVGYIVDIDASDDQLAVLSMGNGITKISILDNNLNVIESRTVTMGYSTGQLAISNNGNVCVSFQNGIVPGFRYVNGEMNADIGWVWADSKHIVEDIREIRSVSAIQNSCRITMIHSLEDTTISETTINNGRLQISDTIKKSGFASFNTYSNDSGFYSLGFTSSDTQENLAQMFKYTFK
ncbi:hypothetical protein A9Q81_06785 [Gammaproteobacteria bacterium 42_54_T18]|nr:hypothetical protein A9Q81_06785 [Gammaproteobacteria bacterium 42_54_T18]